MNTQAQVIPYQQQSLTHSAASLPDLKAQVNLIQHVMKEVMKAGEHYGVIPGCGDKPALLKPGAEKLMLTFRLANDVEMETIDLYNGHREYRVKVTLYSPTGQRLGTGVGSCSTMESKYRFRVGPTELTNKPVPRAYWDLRKENPVKAQELIGGKGFTTKKDEAGEWKIARQGEKVEYDNPADHYNTCLKMAKKRGLVDAVLTSTAASDIFTQDVEEDPELFGAGTTATPASQTPRQQPNQSKKDPPVQRNEGQNSSAADNASIVTSLAARRIPFQVNEETGEIFATPSFEDSGGRELVKSLGFRWDGKAKSWILKTA